MRSQQHKVHLLWIRNSDVSGGLKNGHARSPILVVVEECFSNTSCCWGLRGAHRHLKVAEECKTAAEEVDRRIAMDHQHIQGASFTVSDIADRSERPTSTSQD